MSARRNTTTTTTATEANATQLVDEAPVETLDTETVQETLPFEMPTDPHYSNSPAVIAVGDRVWVRYQRIMRPGTVTALPDDKGRALVKFDYPFNNEVRAALELIFATGDKSGTLSI